VAANSSVSRTVLLPSCMCSLTVPVLPEQVVTSAAT
jgi:hypothetical protein